MKQNYEKNRFLKNNPQKENYFLANFGQIFKNVKNLFHNI